MHGDDNAQGGGWVRRSSRHDVERAAILARRDMMADTTVRKPPNFLRGAHDAPTRMTLRRIHRGLVRFGFNAHVAGRIAPSATAGRLASISTLDFASPPRAHGRRTWWKAFTPLYGERLYILDIGCGHKSWMRWLTECVPEPWIGRFSIVTVDWDARMNPDILGDITRWRTWLQGELAALGYEHVTRWHIVHFAAECTEYSPLKNGRDAERDLTCATWLASCGMELIIQMHPIIWMIECSGAGAHALKTQPIMQDASEHLNHQRRVFRSDTDDDATMTRLETLAGDETNRISLGKIVSHRENAVYARRDHRNSSWITLDSLRTR